MEKYCVSLEIAKKLDKLKVKQDSEFTWFRYKDKSKWYLLHTPRFKQYHLYKYPHLIVEYYSAFTVGELLFKTPEVVITKTGIHYFMRIYKTSNISPDRIMIRYQSNSDRILKTEIGLIALALGEMLIYIIENKLMEVGK